MRLTVGALVTILAGWAAVAVAATHFDRGSLTAFALLLAAAIACEVVDSAERGRLREPTLEQPLRLVSAVHIAAIVLVGPWSAAIVAGGGIVGARAARRSAWSTVLFDAAGFALATLAGGAAFAFAGGARGSAALPDDLVPLLALAVAYLTVRNVVLELVGADEPFHPNLTAAAAEAALGTLIVELATNHAWNALALVPVALAVSRAYARVTALRRDTLRALETFANIVDERDPSTYRHSVRVAAYVDELARALGLPYSDIDRLRWAARLHDLGKVAVDAAVLAKPRSLDAREWEAVRRHPRLSARLLQRFQFTSAEARSVELHHERMDGTGYYGIAGDDLPLAAHVLAVADSFDAMTTDRPYRQGLTKEAALAEIERNAGTQFHPAVAKAFVAVQRGQSPFAALEPHEAAELRAAPARYRLPAIPGARDLKERPGIVAVAGTLLGLIGIGTGDVVVTAVGAAAAAVGGALAKRVRIRAVRLANDLRQAVGAADVEDSLVRVVERFRREGASGWGGVVSWHEFGLGARLEAEAGEGPPEPELIGWLLREADSAQDILLAPGAELGAAGVFAAIPLQRDNGDLVGFLATHWTKALPRHVVGALSASYDELAATFVAALDRRATSAGPSSALVCPGTDVSLISVGPLSTATTEAAATAIARGVSVEVLEVDPRAEWARDAIAASVRNTSRAVVVGNAKLEDELRELGAAATQARLAAPVCTLADPTPDELARRLEDLCSSGAASA
jgi:putative nucleotidyltransferase with HDIG domain